MYIPLSLLYADTKFKCSEDQNGTLVSLYYDIETKIKSYVAGSQSVIVYGVIIIVVGLTGMLILMMIVLLISYANRWNSKFNSEQGEAQLLVVRSIRVTKMEHIKSRINFANSIIIIICVCMTFYMYTQLD